MSTFGQKNQFEHGGRERKYFLFSKVCVDGDHRKALSEARLSRHQPLHPRVREETKVLLRLLPEGAETAAEVVRHGIDLLVGHPPIVAKLQLLEHLAIGLHLVLFPQNVAGAKKSFV